MNSKSGEIALFALIGLLIGSTMLYINSGREAQVRANATGLTVSQWDVVTENPGKSTLTVLAPAAAGAGVGWLLDEVTGGEDKGSGNVNINASTQEGNVTVSVIGDQDNDTSSNTRTDTRNEGSNNQ